MEYQDALDFIWGLVNFETTPPATRDPYKLDRMVALMARLGDPQARLRAVHVAGTKGKGSTAAMLERVLRAAGHRTGLYTSPHLHDPRERLRIMGEPIPKEEFVALVARLRPLIEEFQTVTTFEALTAMAFLWFAEVGVEVGVIEVGLGGRLDATNLLTPLMSVITPLALEHTAVLGNSIEEIASEKGGIIKPGVPVLTAAQVPEALAVLRQIATERGSALTVVPERWQGQRTQVSLDGQKFDLWETPPDESPTLRYPALPLGLLGGHQVANATVAVAALHLLREQGVGWDEAALREGLASVTWPARVEVLRRAPFVIADGAHTAESAQALVATLRELLPGGWGRSTLILGISADKELGTLWEALEPLAERLILTRSRHPRAMEPAVLAAHPALAGRALETTPDIPEALVMALHEAAPNDLIVVTGSLFVAAAAREAMDRG